MRFLSLAALQVAFTDLFANRHTALILSSAGKTYEPILLDKKALIDALPAALTGSKPLAEELTLADEDHDGFGAAIWHITEGYARWPDVPANVLAAVERVRAAFIPQLDDLRASYVKEADAAILHKADLQTLKADLLLIPIAGGLSLFDLATGFVAGGDKLSALLSQRADVDTGARSEASKLRSASVGVLGRCRGAIRDEMAINSALPKDLDAQVFGYFDELEKMRAAALAARPRKAAPPKPPPAEGGA